jgi:hypothetical protein
LEEVVKTGKFVIFLILLTFAAPAHAATIYKWVDEKGVVNFTDDSNKVPPAYRDRVEVEEYLREEGTPAPALDMAAKTKEEIKADIYGRDETRWKEKVLSQENRLDEATSNYEMAGEGILKEGERLVWHRYGGKTQYQMISAELSGISERLEKFKGEIAEAKAMLDKLSKEAEIIEGVQEQRAAPLVKNEKIIADLYGRDETWWKEKVRPWKEQLKETIDKFEEARDSFVKQAEGLGPFMFGRLSLTQYQMISSRLVVSNDQMAKYETQITEAKAMLAKLLKEAKETKADPTWLE